MIVVMDSARQKAAWLPMILISREFRAGQVSDDLIAMIRFSLYVRRFRIAPVI